MGFIPITGIIVGILVIAIVEISLFRSKRRPESSASQVGEAEERSGDGEQIIVYIHRKGMLQYTGFMIFLLLLCVVAAGNAFILPQDTLEPVVWQESVLFFGAIACLLAIQALRYFVRSMKRSPTLIVNADGINVYRSSSGSRKGPLPWDEIAWVGYEIRPGAGGIQLCLIINLYQSPTASVRGPRTTIPSPTAPYPFTTTIVRIAEEMLDMPVGELAYQIERYIKAHVPSGWHGWLSEERGDDGQIINPPASIPTW